MQEENHHYFMLGNAIMVVALVVLLLMGSLWERFGVAAMALWLALVGVGIFLLYKAQEDDPGAPD